MQIRFAVSEAEFAEACGLRAKEARRLRHSSYLRSWRGLALLLLLLSAGLLINQLDRKVVTAILLVLGATYAASFVFQRLICPRRIRKSYRQQLPGMDVRILIAEDRIEVDRSDGAVYGRYSWNAFQGLLEGPGTFVLYLNPLQFIVLPKRALSSQEQQELLAMLKLHIRDKGPDLWKSLPAVSGR